MNALRCLGYNNLFSNLLFKSFSKTKAISFPNGREIFQPREFSCLSKSINRISLTPSSSTLILSCGMKVKGNLHLRCKDCYFIRLDGRMMVHCPTYGRHKQMAKMKREKYQWILSHCMQSKKRPY